MKIASIGVAVRKWVTYHGIALNVSTDLSRFNTINPCGLESSVMTSLSRCCEGPVTMAAVKGAFIQEFEDVFSCSLTQAPTDIVSATP